MPTNTTVKELKINKLTEAQYDAAVQGGTIGANELSFLTDVDMGSIQVSSLPTASASEEGKIYQYVGATDSTYTNGYFYKCVSDGQTPATYSWQQTNVQAGGAAQVNSDWNAVSGVAEILNKPVLGTAAYMDSTDFVTTSTAQTISARKTTTSQIKLEGSSARIEFGTTSSENLPVFERNINTNTIEVGASTQSLNLRGSSNLTYNNNRVAMYSDVSSVQTQLNSKQNTITGAASSITSSNLSSNYALVSNASGKVGTSTVTSTELGYLSGATSNIQTQLNNKQATISDLSTIRSGAAAGATAIQPGDNISDLTNDAGYITGINSSDVETALGYVPADESSLATVATSGDYNDLINTPTIPCILLDYVVTDSTGVITIETSSAPTTKTVKEVIGGASIAGTWTTTDATHYVFTPTTASDILDNANGFMIKVA